MLLAIVELLRPYTQRLQHGFTTPSHLHRSNKPIPRGNKNEHRHTSQKPEWLKQEIIHLKACTPKAGCRSIADICNRRFAASRKITVGKAFVHQVLQRHDYEIQILRRNLKHAKPKAVPRNLIWGLDLTGRTDAQGRLLNLLGIIDHGSRALLHLRVLHDKTARTLIACISEVTRTHGKPRIIRTDNEGMFGSPAFGSALEQLGIRHQLTDPGCPWQNGRIERPFGTLKEKLDQRIYSPLPHGAGEGECTGATQPRPEHIPALVQPRKAAPES